MAEYDTEYSITELTLLNILHPVRFKWRYIGYGLKISNGDLDAINSDNSNVQACLCAVLAKRMSADEPITLKELCTVLRLPIVGERDLADRLEGKKSLNGQDIERDGLDQRITKFNVIHCIEPRIPESVFQYRVLLKLNEYPILRGLAFAIFMALQCLVVADDKAFRPKSFLSEEHMNRIVFCALRIILLVITPIIWYRQLCALSYLEKKASNHGSIELSQSVMEDVENILKKQNKSFKLLCFRVKLAHFQILTHAVLLPVLLYNLGILRHPQADQARIGEHSLRQTLQTENGTQIIEIWECIAIGITLLLLGLGKSMYSFENRLTTVIVENGYCGGYQCQIFRAIRERWSSTDVGLLRLSGIFIALTGGLLIWGEPFILKNNTTSITQVELNLLTLLVLLLQLLGSSAKHDFKLLSLVFYFLTCSTSLLFCYTAQTETFFPEQVKARFLDAPGNVSMVLYSVEVVTLLNWLYSLLCSYQYQTKTWQYHGCFLLMAMLVVSLCAVTVRELKYLAEWKVPVQALSIETW